ncbi:DUF2157 domain-containing protein [Actinoplanes rectilineatus]|uniref:DUF2157 domain-containing protein n=1 Tax=Actinoplanes rectilineatus TaxID=113571 RepID=UPI0005F2C8FE|nr:DUF2157 domain-containing protein [Actinoplanes rectilineatus]
MDQPEDQPAPPDERAGEPAPMSAPMSAPTSTPAFEPVSEPVDSGRLSAALDRLVGRGEITSAQAGAVLREYRGPGDALRGPGLRRQLGEIAGYLGASFVVGAVALFLGEEWEVLGRLGRVAILGAMTAVLFAAGVAVRWRAAAPGARWWRPWPGDSVRRRLASTLVTGAALAAGVAVYAGFDADPVSFSPPAYAPLLASAVGLAVVILGYLLARSALGQLAAAVGAFWTMGNLLDVLNLDDMAAYGAGSLLLGLAWVGLAWQRLAVEHRFALAIAVTFGLLGAQLIVGGDTGAQNHLGYALTALVTGACFAAYARLREWVVLVGGVVGATLVVPEFLYDVTGGALGTSGVMLVAGVTLLGGSLAGLRLRNTTTEAAAVTDG